MGYYAKKFQVPRSHSIGEKCDANFMLPSHFSQKMCDRRIIMKFGLHRVSILVYTKKISSSSVAQYRRKVRC